MITKADIKHIQSLEQKKYRAIHHQFFIEGKRLVGEALRSGERLHSVFFTENFQANNSNLTDELKKMCLQVHIISEKEMISLSSTKTPSGLLAVCHIPADISKQNKENENWLYLDGVSDPGNMGTLLRTAAWFGINHIALSKNCVDVYNPKIVRSGMGAHFYLKSISNQSLKQFRKSHTIIGADQSGNSINDFEITPPWILVLGNEAHGLSKNTKELLDHIISIPKVGYGESLNVAVAGGIIMEKLVEC